MKRKIVSVLLCTAMVLGSLGMGVCAEEGEERTMTFLHWRTEDKAAFEELARQYEELNPGLHIEIEIVPSEDYAKTLIMRAQGGEASDVFAVNPDGDFGSEIATGALMELNDCEEILDNFQKTLWEREPEMEKSMRLCRPQILWPSIIIRQFLRSMGSRCLPQWKSL